MTNRTRNEEVAAMRTALLEIARTSATGLVGLYAGGVFFQVIAPSLGRMPASAYVPYWQAMNADYGRVMPPLLLSTLGLVAAAGALSWGRGWPFALTVAAAVLIVATIVLTVTRMEPLNHLADAWSADRVPADWEAVRRQWLTLHSVRTVVAVAAFGCLLAARVTDR
ncbi:anthrone oxygenase family protein [Dactylosporangium sp. CA-233914]|uniref:anthrone oxygenase family protein n=1 Tax=Dactylosporangium sp. CA-233914 TaxID=3239934 RepID=UPI003D8FF06F